MVLEVVLGHIVFLFVIGIAQYRDFTASLNSVDQLKLLIAKFIQNIMNYYIFLTVTVIYNTALSLRSSFKGLKKYLVKTLKVEHNIILTRCNSVGQLLPQISIIEDNTFRRLLEASKIFNLLFDCVDIFNNIFGVVILFMNIATVLKILVSLNTLLITGETDQLTVEIAFNSICGFLMFVAWNWLVIASCGLIKQESTHILNLCCKLQHSLPYSSKERHELLYLARQINRKFPTISAAGFFEVDFSLIVSVFSYVGTYIVVLIQFSHIDF
ncbi:uncharacterized protein LOC114326552 [Diabrotica virgifera virgifera]|uniref:Uncharacterized protein LOC114326552 isoform X1 n=2 Tax=Diabrotica virgifera virgifera TaxID=50390 RepID=A0A6P7FBC0_DIAVI|nr:uncharacterized protein LOC114326552 [Diabrotica virgifera virgifera]